MCHTVRSVRKPNHTKFLGRETDVSLVCSSSATRICSTFLFMSTYLKVNIIWAFIMMISLGCTHNQAQEKEAPNEKRDSQNDENGLRERKKKVKYIVYKGEISVESGVYKESGTGAYEMADTRTYTVKVMPDLSSASINDGPFTNLTHNRDNVYLFTWGTMAGSGISVTPTHVTILNYDGSVFGTVYKNEEVYE